MLDAFIGTRALVGGIKGARDGGGFGGFVKGATERALNLHKEEGIPSEITDEISEINDKVDTLLADKNSSSPTFNPQSARTMNAVSDPNQVSPGLPFYQNT